MKNKILIAVMTLCLAVMGIAGWNLYSTLREYKAGENTYEDVVAAAVIMPEESGDDDSEVEEDDLMDNDLEEPDAEIISANVDLPEIDWDALYAINSEIVGWIYIPDTEINYPVCQTTDDSYYLHYLVDGTYNSSGTIFVETQNVMPFENDNTILYGHHMKNGSMFTGITKYKDQSYYEEHPVGYFLTEDTSYCLVFFSGYETESVSEAYTIQFGKETGFLEWIQSVALKSTFTTSDISIANTDHIVTLSTCDYEFTNARYVLHAKLVDMG